MHDASSTLKEIEGMELFLKELLLEVEDNQSKIINRLEEAHRKVEELLKEKKEVEEKTENNISFFNLNSAKEREKLPKLEREVLQAYEELNKIKEKLTLENSKILKIGALIEYIKRTSGIYTEDIDSKVQDGINILEIQEFERKRIARELHDSTVQNLTNLVHKTELCSKIIDKDTIQVKLELISMIETIRSTIKDMRGIIYDLRPMSIDDLGLVATVERYITQMKNLYGNIKIELVVENEEIELISVISLTVYRIIQEACNNIFKYAKATIILISIAFHEEEIEVAIEDDGVGFDIETINNKKREDNSGFGLSIMKERGKLLGGEVTWNSELGKGTKVSVKLPLQSI